MDSVSRLYFHYFFKFLICSLQEIAEPSDEAKNDQLSLWLWLTSEKWTKLDDAMKECNVQPVLPKVYDSSNLSVPNIKDKTKTVNLNAETGSLTSTTLAS